MCCCCGWRRWNGVCRAVLDDLSAGSNVGRSGPEGRAREHGGVRNAIHKTEIDGATGEEVEVEIPYMKGYTVFNVEQIDGLPDRYHATLAAPVRSTPSVTLSSMRFAATGRHDPPRWQSGVLRDPFRFDPDAAV